MTTRQCMLILALLASWALLISWNGSASASTQEAARPEAGSLAAPSSDQIDSWYYRTPETSPKKTIPQQKAELRAQQRMARLASQRWYGYSNARPTVAAMPFTSMYRPAWQQPGGRPYHWHRPVVVIVR